MPNEFRFFCVNLTHSRSRVHFSHFYCFYKILRRWLIFWQYFIYKNERLYRTKFLSAESRIFRNSGTQKNAFFVFIWCMVQIKIEKLCNNCLAKIILQKINARDDDSSTVRKTAQDASIRQPLFFHINWVIFKKFSKNIENTPKK